MRDSFPSDEAEVDSPGDENEVESTGGRAEVKQTTGEAGDVPEGDGTGTLSRRGFVRATGATAAAAGATVLGSDDATAQAQTYRFGGEVQAWQGREPSDIEGASNPTIELEAGTEYEFWFENIDGEPHNMTIQDADGNAIVQSELISNQGGTASVTFTAQSNMAQYICTIHPSTMVGDLEITGQAEGDEQGGGGLSLLALLMVGAMVLAFLSPLLFAVFLFSRGRGGGETTTGRA